MNIIKTVENENVIFALEGRLDTNTSPELEENIDEVLKDDKNVVLEFKQLEFISSAGLRVLLNTQQKLSKKNRTFTIKNVNAAIMQIFNITKFTKILNIQ